MNKRRGATFFAFTLLLAGCVQIQIKEWPGAATHASAEKRTTLLNDPIEWDKEVLAVARIRLWGHPSMEEGKRALDRAGRAKGWRATTLRQAWLQDNGKTLVLVGQPTESRKSATMKHDQKGRPSAY